MRAGDMDLDSLEYRARAQLAPGVYDYFAGGAGSETTLVDNVAAWSRWRVRHRVLRDVAAVSTSTTVLGAEVANPVLVAPVAYQGLAHPDGELATAAGAAAAGSLMVISSRASTDVGQVAATAPEGPKWLQVYILRDRDWTEELVNRAVAGGCQALVLTGDTPFLGPRLRDVANNFVVPSQLARANRANLVPPASEGSTPPGTDVPAPGGVLAPAGQGDYLALDQDPSVTFDDIAWLGGISGLPVLVKGVVRADDALRCMEAGAAGVVVSNHGGRQLDGSVASADALVEVAQALSGSGQGEVYVDGGIRSGTDVLKALALGAKAVMVGRPILWGLAVGGPDGRGGAAGVAGVLDGLREELAVAMGLAGAAGVADLSPDLISK
ncbi:MAG: alpha-hydroxy acid oxidase [Acidimicrobiales bacterium]